MTYYDIEFEKELSICLKFKMHILKEVYFLLFTVNFQI